LFSPSPSSSGHSNECLDSAHRESARAPLPRAFLCGVGRMSIEEEEMMVEEAMPGEGADFYGEETPLADIEQEQGEQQEEEEEEEVTGVAGAYNSKEVNDQIFEELRLGAGIAEEVQSVWRYFLSSAESREAAGEAIYAALFDAAPSLQSLFKTPRAVMAMRFMNGLNQIISSLTDPKGLKVVVETLGFQHLDLEVTIPRVIIFRDAIVDLLQVELATRFTPKAKDGWMTFLNYVGGSYIYVRVKFSERLKTISASWAQATKKAVDEVALAEDEGKDGEEAQGGEEGGGSGSAEEQAAGAGKGLEAAAAEKKRRKTTKSWFGGSKASSGKEGAADASEVAGSGDKADFQNTSVPTTYDEMFLFNSAVMGFGNHIWMNEVLASFDTIVTNVSNSYRLQEECDVLSLRLAKYKGNINLPEYKAVMLASLRSLCKDWGSLHEVSWSWLWENVERMLRALMGKPAAQERALAALYGSLDESALMVIRKEVYQKFFALAPAGQDFFKQSTTRLYFIADKLVAMTLDMYKEPKRMVEDISALGLRHVGYGIPTDLFGPFVTGCVQVIRMLTDDDAAEEAFRWSLSLISRMLTRVINEGSTIVMKAINVNSSKMLKKAVACAPRGKRALWMLNIQVGTQSISPLMWAIETGSLEAATAIIADLLTIRADRDRYYYGMDIMFERHPDIIQRLCLDAPALMPMMLDGLIWRSRVTESGQRRVNYYIKHLVVDAHGDFNKAIEWVTENGDPKLVCHPILSIVTDMVWSRVAFRTFLYNKAWFLFTLIVFVSSQAVLNHLNKGDGSGSGSGSSSGRRLASAEASTSASAASSEDGFTHTTDLPIEIRAAIFACRCFIYICSMGQWVIFHAKNSLRDFRNRALVRWGRCAIPEYLCAWQGWSSLCLTMFLFLMLCMEPILHCFQHNDGFLFTEHCFEGENLLFPYSIMSTAAMLLYFLLLSDLSVFSTRVSSFALICTRVISEVTLFLFGLTFFVASFACAVSALEQDDPDFAGIPKSALQLYKITLGMFSGLHYDMLMDYPALMAAIFIYVTTTVIFMLNLLIAQLNCAYQATYQDMLGFARLNRGKIVTETMPAVSKSRWSRFVTSLKLEDRVEFGEGDMGVAGGIQVWESASANVTTVDMIRRFGGSTSPAAQWPEEENAGDDEEDRFDRMEKLIEKAMKRMSSGSKGGKKGSAQGSSMGQSSSDQGGGEDGSAYESGDE